MQGMHYRAIDRQGDVHVGFSIGSESDTDVEQWIVHRGWQPLPVSLFQRLQNGLKLAPRSANWSKNSASLFTLNFAQLLGAGVPLLQALEELGKLESSPQVRSALQQVHAQIDRGDCLSDALADCPELFEEDYIASVRAGERSGKLSYSLEIQAKNMQWQSDLANRLKSVLAYPAFALVSLVVVLLFVLLYLIPAMQPLLSMGTETLPMHTRWLLGLSAALVHSGVWIFIVFCGLVVGLVSLCRLDTSAKRFVQAALLRGQYGQVVTNFSLARYARSVSILYEAGIELIDAMQISQKLVKNRLLRAQLNSASQRVLNGETLGKAMQAQEQLPTLFKRMVIAGERAGVLDVALRQCADQLQSNAQHSLDRIERLIGPVLLCAMGAVLLWVAVSILGPIYASISQVGSFV